MTSWSGPEFLSDDHVPTRRVRCPVHGFIRYSPPEQEIIDHWTFQRLRNVRQLALTSYVYPGAMHSRFEHSLGVMELAAQAFDALSLRYSASLRENFDTLPELRVQPLAKARQLVRLMGLLHDIGQPAFSHSGECILPKDPSSGRRMKHEDLSAWVVSANGPLGSRLDGGFFPGASKLLEVTFRGNEQEIPPQLFVLKQLISGQLDLDRMDYLLRDSLHCGVEYGRYDHVRLISSLAVHLNEYTDSLAIGVDEGGVHSFEALILARYYMTTQVYSHRVRRAYDMLLRSWLEAWVAANYTPIQRVLEYDDVLLLALMREDAGGGNGNDRKLWAERILRRQHPRKVWEWGEHADAREVLKARRIKAQLEQEFSDATFLLDDMSGSVHNLFVSGDPEMGDELFVVNRLGGKREGVSERSKIIQKIPKTYRVVRIFGYYSRPEQRINVERRAAQLATAS